MTSSLVTIDGLIKLHRSGPIEFLRRHHSLKMLCFFSTQVYTNWSLRNMMTENLAIME